MGFGFKYGVWGGAKVGFELRFHDSKFRILPIMPEAEIASPGERSAVTLEIGNGVVGDPL